MAREANKTIKVVEYGALRPQRLLVGVVVSRADPLEVVRKLVYGAGPCAAGAQWRVEANGFGRRRSVRGLARLEDARAVAV